MDKNLLLVGGGGHCKTVIEAIESTASYDNIGIIDIKSNVGNNILGYPIVGHDADLIRLRDKGYREAFVSMGSIGMSQKRIELFEVLKKLSFLVPSIIDRSANVSRYSTLSDGILIGKNVIINAGCRIGKGAILNTGCIVEHDCVVGDFVHIAPGTVLSGNVTIGNGSHIGANSVVRQNIKIGEGTIIGVGSVVVKDIQEHYLAYGNPCLEVEKL